MPLRANERAAALIIAGGRGTRFWPESRAGRPKPLFSLDGKTSLLADTIARVMPLIVRDNVFVLVSADQQAAFRRAVRGQIPPANLIVEPEGRGTAVAIAYGAAVIGKRLGADTVVAAMPADHHIAPAAGFRGTIGDAIGLAAASGAIVVVGITPTRAESGFGYQKIGHAVGAGFKVDRFIEKPSPARARQMVRSGKFLWNAGMFVMRIDTLEAQLETHAPALANSMRRLGEASRRPDGRTDLARIYRGLDLDSFDRVVAEKSRNVLGVRARFRWHDVGSWEGLWEAMRGEGSNVLSGNVVALGADGVLARGGKRLMVLLGVSDLIAVDTGDALLIARRSESQEIRHVIDELGRRGMGRYL
jgi:mannose-1-phosphate guanylyltransferase